MNKVGVYAYVEKKTGIPHYVGVDSNIYRDLRDIEHRDPRNKNKQYVNTVIQQYPNNWYYLVVCRCDSKNMAHQIERALIKFWGTEDLLNRK